MRVKGLCAENPILLQYSHVSVLVGMVISSAHEIGGHTIHKYLLPGQTSTLSDKTITSITV